MAQDSKILELLELQSKLLATLTQGNASSINQDLLMEKLSISITEFCYDQANSSTFNNWYARFEDIFLVEGKDLDDAARVRLLMRKLNNIAYGQYSAYILPRNPRDVTFADTVKILKDMYGIQDSIFSIRYKCLQTVKMSHEDLISYGARVNKLCENFKLSEMNADEFKCLVFVCGLQSNAYSDVRMRCLSALEDDRNQNINKLITSAQRLLNLKHDTAMVEVNTQSSINAIKSNLKSNDDFKDWLEIFGLWDKPLSNVCSQIKDQEIDINVLHNIKSEYADIFQNSPSKCTKAQVHLQLKPNVKPIFRVKRPVGYAMLSLIEDELQRLETLGIINPVDNAEWAAPIVAVKKPNGKVRICGDYSSGLNDSLEPHMYPLHRPEDLYAKVGNSCLFTHIDLSDAYLQTEVSPDSAKLLTINTHKGLYTFNRLAPGVKSAPGAFQQLMDTMLIGIDDTAAYIDDIIVGGKTVEKHIDNVKRVLQRLREYSFHIKFEKCTFFAKEVKYLGNIMPSSGLRPDKEKIKAILDLPPPSNISELRSFLGSINYYGKYVKNMTNLRTPLDHLLQDNTKFKWSNECQQSFEKFKEILNSDLLLTHYNPDLPIKVAADASGKGIGAYICHIFPDNSEKVIEHASRTLTPAEKNYAQIEKEALGLVYAVEKFHNQPDSIQLMLELFGIKPNFINQSHIRPPVENSTPSTPLRLVEANVTASTPEQRQVEANSTPSSPENQLHSPLTFSTPIAEPPASISRPKRNVKPPERFGFTN
ncbi:uncharacterized protein K02A2.6-like [Lucilia sericata]|uniref:uncharacterized protein K02A2.6-like n=1 Tax=Lucilia sericata TaxID=13632 RepID=UPI0018A82656|nr:uncharacterized protein K02A2.6-like [Lucilia sericata]